MTLAVHTFETNATEENLSFAFHETLAEGQEVYFLAKFHPGTQDAQNYAEGVFGTLIDTFEESNGKNTYDTFEEALKLANGEIKKRQIKKEFVPDIVIAFFDFHNLYLSQTGKPETYLLREGSLSQITEMESDAETFSNILSGQIAIHDVLIVATSRILRVLTNNQLIEMFDSNNFSSNVATLKQELRTKTKESILISVIGVGKQKENEKGGFLSKIVSKKKNNEEIESIPPTEISVEEPPIETPPVAKKEESTMNEQVNNVLNQPSKDETRVIENTETEDSTINSEEKMEFIIPSPQKKKSTDTIQKNIKEWSQTMKQMIGKKNPQKKIIIAAVSILVVLGLIITVRIIQNHDSEIELTLRQDIQLSRDTIKQANELLFQGDRKGANDLLKSAEELILPALNSEYVEIRDTARFLKADIENQKLEAENAIKVNPKDIADLGSKHGDLEVLGFNELRGNLYVHDTRNIYKTIRSIVENPITLTTQEAITASSVRTEQDTLIFLTNTPRIIEYKGGVVSQMNTKDTTWKKGVDIDVYGSRYTYILDPVSNQIWKYERRRSDYSEGVAYNKTADLSRAISMAIDGNIFILSDDGKIQKLLRGENESYEFRDLPSVPFGGKKLKLFTSENHDFLYILDPSNSRVLIFQKGELFATYRKQVIFENIPEAIDFVISESGQKVNILTKDKIYEFDL